jgi:hypothetical protein
MNALIGSPALTLLLRLKLRGSLRRHWRRLRTPRGLLLTLFGLAAFGSWIASLAFSFLQPSKVLLGEAAEIRVRVSGMLLAVLSLSGALTHRGLYLPKNEAERLFSAPLSRATLVRYRLLAGGLRSLLGGMILGLYGARRLPNPPLAFAGILLAMQFLAVLNQFVAIALGGVELRAARLLRSVGTTLLVLGITSLALLTAALATNHPLESIPVIGATLGELLASSGDPLTHPVLARLTLPILPWARLITAETPAEFVPWFLICLALHGLLIEASARLPVDFRELSLATAARVASRLARVRRGGGVAATRASAAAAARKVPWLFGRGPLGAIAWKKSAGLARKARGAFWVALVALVFITLLANLMFPAHDDGRRLGAPVLIAILGTIYLCSGLRFDFREELERMDVVRAWPVSNERVFVAMLLPEVVLVSILLVFAVLFQCALTDGFSLHVVFVLLGVPLLVFAWVGLDNAVFLLAPVRTTPGQDGLVQNAGQRMIQMLLLLILALALGGLGYLAALGTMALVGKVLGASLVLTLAAAYAAVLCVLLLGDLALIWLGGSVLRRFDVARDRG